jgi:hypothetical protein
MMIWLLISIALSGNVTTTYFATKNECEFARSWIAINSGKNTYSEVRSNTCMEVQSPFLIRK